MRKTKFIAYAMFALMVFSLVATSTFGVAFDSSSKISPYLLEQLDSLADGETVLADVYVNEFSNSKFDKIADKIGKKNIVATYYPEGFIVKLDKGQVFALAEKSYIDGIYPNVVVKPVLQDAVEITGAKDVWEFEAEGELLTGEGETVCVIDSGVDFTHPDLDSPLCNLDCVEGVDCPLDCDRGDFYGHGTHVAGIVAANGGIRGIAPDAQIISARVFNETSPTAPSFVIGRAINWCVNNADRYDISVISMSLGGDTQYNQYCDFISGYVTAGINNATEKNIAVVVASGNNGNTNGISWPSCVTNAIPVGATDKSDNKWVNSNYHEGMMKLFAPGVDINSTLPLWSELDYGGSTGTSMATPMVSGSIVLIQQYLREIGEPKSMHPKDDIEVLLYSSGGVVKDLPGDSWRRINVRDALLSLDKSAPEVKLVSPENGEHFPQEGPQSVEFVCEVSDWQLLKATLVIDYIGRENSYRESKDISGEFAQVSFEKELENGYYRWNCEVEDAKGNVGKADVDLGGDLFVVGPYVLSTNKGRP